MCCIIVMLEIINKHNHWKALERPKAGRNETGRKPPEEGSAAEKICDHKAFA